MSPRSFLAQRARRYLLVGLPTSADLVAVLLLTIACVPTGPTPGPNSSPISTPPASPSSSPAASSHDPPAYVLDLETGGQTTRLFVFDPYALVVEARPADAREAAAAMDRLLASAIVTLPGRSDEWIIVGWLVTPCDRQAALTVVATVITVQLPPRPGCDALAIGRVVALRFADPARAALFEARLIEAPILPEVEPPTPVAPPPTAEG
jgi:hypothetical protein